MYTEVGTLLIVKDENYINCIVGQRPYNANKYIVLYCYIPNMNALALTILDKKILLTLLPWQPVFFTEFNFLKYFEERDLRIISVKFDLNMIVSLGKEDFFFFFFCNCERTDGRQTDHNISF